MIQTFDVAIIGAGVVGSAIARELSRYQLEIALVESEPDVGMGTSKASTAIWHTGYDAKPGSLEAKLLKRSYALMDKFLPEANIPHERLGGLLIAWNEEQLETLPKLLKQARDNGETEVKIISTEEIYQREPNIHKGALGGLFVAGEGILCTFTVPLALATQAVLNGAKLFLNYQVSDIQQQSSNDGPWSIVNVQSSTDPIHSRYVVNTAGLFSDEINAKFGHTNFTVTPRRGQLIVFDKLARPLVNHVLLPVPTSKTKGVLISPTVYGNILLGPTAEDLSDKTATQTTADGLRMLIDKGREILPQLLNEEVTATYSGLRAATEHSDYRIEMHAGQKYLCVGGIRSTGISGAMGIAEYSVELLHSAGLNLKLKENFKAVKMPTIGQVDIRPHQDGELIAKNPQYAEMVCHCERVSRGELTDAMNAVIPATNLDGLRRRTRASQGRCQGFNCHAALLKTLESDSLLSGFKHKMQVQLSNPATVREIGYQHGSERNAAQMSQQSLAMTVDVLIVGSGPAGLSTAIELKKQGIKNILVVDREPEAGGMPRMCHHIGFGREDLWRMYSGPRYARYYRELAGKYDVEIHTSTTITGWVDSKLRKSFVESSSGESPKKTSEVLAFTSPGGLGTVEAGAVLLATGVRERPRSARLIPGTRPQGVFTTGSLQRFVYQEHLPVGKRAVIVGAELVSLSALMTLGHANIECLMMTTEEPRHQIKFPYIVMKWAVVDILTRTPIVTRTRVTNIFGHKRVEAIELTRSRLPKFFERNPNLDEFDQTSEVFIVECDTVIFTGNWIPENEMARLGGLAIDPIKCGPRIDYEFQSSVKGVFVAGNLLRGVETADHCALEGIKAGRAMAKYLRKK